MLNANIHFLSSLWDINQASLFRTYKYLFSRQVPDVGGLDFLYRVDTDVLPDFLSLGLCIAMSWLHRPRANRQGKPDHAIAAGYLSNEHIYIIISIPPFNLLCFIMFLSVLPIYTTSRHGFFKNKCVCNYSCIFGVWIRNSDFLVFSMMLLLFKAPMWFLWKLIFNKIWSVNLNTIIAALGPAWHPLGC